MVGTVWMGTVASTFAVQLVRLVSAQANLSRQDLGETALVFAAATAWVVFLLGVGYRLLRLRKSGRAVMIVLLSLVALANAILLVLYASGGINATGVTVARAATLLVLSTAGLVYLTRPGVKSLFVEPDPPPLQIH
jgi:hypothetical protein